MKKSCTYCGKVHDKKIICKAKYKSLTRIRDTKADKFRSSSEWQCKRLEIKQRDLFLCQICMRLTGLDINPYSKQNVSVHHIIGLQQDFDKRLDNDNLITLCEYHHKQADSGKISVQEMMRIAQEQNSPHHNQFFK